MSQKKFKRHEIKYLITQKQYHELLDVLCQYMTPDKYHLSTIRNIYYDTDDYYMIRHSIEKPTYKEKLRIRAYRTVDSSGNVFVELKKKYNGIVYKRREEMPYQTACDFLNKKVKPFNTQIINEISYVLDYYKVLKPRIYISYKREAFLGKEDKNFRITFDTDIQWRDYDIDLTKEPYGYQILDDKYILMEVKTIMGLPRWLLDFLGYNQIYKQSFSKYGNAYKQLIAKEKEEKQYA